MSIIYGQFIAMLYRSTQILISLSLSFFGAILQVLGADAVAIESGIVKHLANIPTSGHSEEVPLFSVPGQVR